MNEILKRVLKKVIPGSFRQALKKQTFLISEQEIEEVLRTPGLAINPGLLRKVNRKVHVNDDMYEKNGSVQYLQIAISALNCIEKAMSDMQVTSIQSILDLPSGYGRVLRVLAERFPGCALTACDTNTNAVHFCHETFGVHSVYSQSNLADFNLGKKFDLIWCGSLATHLHKEGTTELLLFFDRHLNSGGLLVFSMHGQFSLNKLKTGELDYGLPKESVARIIKDTVKTGYGYSDYPNTNGYGISVASTEWINNCLSNIGNWKDSRFYPTGWTYHHDIYALVKE